jgi:octaheme c-type cytochrome (tetrathionate reductase family)
MREFRYTWALGLTATILLVVVPILAFVRWDPQPVDDPWAFLPVHPPHTDHSDLFEGPLTTGPEVTAACLECHPDAAHEVAMTAHWTWLGDPVQIEGHAEPVAIGKANLLNNFCIGIQSNWPGCTSCHAGYGWEDAGFDFANEGNVDCLICHADPSTYAKDDAGYPAEGVDLLAAAQSVRAPTRENCGACHFSGGGGNAVKHGDLDGSLFFPDEHIDVHMGRLGFACTDCHQTENHLILGRSISVSVDTANQIYCTDCHSTELHDDQRISDHVDTVACQTCHIPLGAVREPTKIHWDWSTAGQDWPEDPHEYLRIKGSFVYAANIMPEYYWFNGQADRYLLGDPIDPEGVTLINEPLGGIEDPSALIWPFKVHRAIQMFDAVYNYLLQPRTVGEGGYWTEFDWDLALRLGSEATGLPYSGSFDWAETAMYWPLSHMVVPAEHALQCQDCHGENGRMDWEALGYFGDPMLWGGREAEGGQGGAQ